MEEECSQAQAALASADARIVTTVSATDQLVSEDPTTGSAGDDRGEPTAPAEELPRLAAEALAQGLSPSTTVIGGEVVGDLLSAGFLAPIGPGPSQATLEEIGAPGQVVVVLSGGRGGRRSPEAFAVPLVERLAGLGVPVAAGESLLTDYPYVSLVRADGDGTVTVDDLDQSMGGAALVLGLEDLLTSVGGAYGVKDGAEPFPPAVSRGLTMRDRTRERSSRERGSSRSSRRAMRPDGSARASPRSEARRRGRRRGRRVGDRTASEAASAGATVLRTARRKGKGGALEGALRRLGPADVWLLADGDLGATASNLAPLLEAVTSGQADLAIAVLSPARAGGSGS